MSGPREATPGARCLRLVEEYSALGHHRTGTEVDTATRAWLAEELEARGARVRELPFELDRFVGTSEVTIDDVELASMPVWYSAVGEHRGVVAVEELDMLGEVVALDLDARVDAARGRGADIAVLSTGAQLVAHNRPPVVPTGPAAVLVARGGATGPATGPATVRMTGDVETATSATVLAHFGDDGGRPIVLSTPLTGWFHCAGERGTGIAVLLELAPRIAADHPVLVVATTGHELGHLGLRDLVRREPPDPRAVVHIGASVAVGVASASGGLELAPTRVALVDADPVTTVAITRALEPASLPIASEGWAGVEGGDWRTLGAPTLSVTGAGPGFHTPADVPAAVTAPELLETVLDALTDAVEALERGAADAGR